MNAHANIPTDKEVQSLTAKCRDGHHELFQLFTKLEIALANLIGAIPIAATSGSNRTFGNKLRLAIMLKPTLKDHLELIPLRNLVAHAKFEIVKIDGRHGVVMLVADVDSAMNARLIFEDQWKATHGAWRMAVKSALDAVQA